MQLVRVAGVRRVQRLEKFGRAALDGAVVDDRHTRAEGGEEWRPSGVDAAVMRDQIDVDRTDPVVRARERVERRGGGDAAGEEKENAAPQAEGGGPPGVLRVLRPPRR